MLDYKPVFDRQMPVLDALGMLPRTTGALEAVLFKTVTPSIDSRSRGFGNLVRTNRLLDLMVLHANGQLDNAAAVAAALRREPRLTTATRHRPGPSWTRACTGR